ncbi:NAD(P)H-dependent oxidoreductase [Acidimangrovimonas pyrenivorans]|uniref:NAD(P)H-dependent oxidoreductase n=1 Tax=Acidimangrovimonas pyrenivorans TaxID=2030798 RepID=A0ABV7AJW0_9RHOB
MAARHFLFLLSSARPGGNSAALARTAAEGLSAEDSQDWRDLTNPLLPPFHDLRHAGGYAPPEGVAADLARATMAATDIVLVAPLYWYGLPAPAKLYLDHWSHWMRVEELGFKPAMAAKTLWLVMAHSGSTPAQIGPAVEMLRFTSDYLKMRWGGALLADANAPGDLAQDGAALARASGFFAGS